MAAYTEACSFHHRRVSANAWARGPLNPAATLTAYIAQVALGDVAHGTIEYQSIFAVGLVLLLMTLVLNILGHYLRRRYREVY